MILELKIKYHVEDLIRIEKIEKGDWIDLRSAYDYELKEGSFQLIDLGVSIKIPEGYEAHLAPRSSTFKKYGLIQTNSVGVIDSSYCGENDRWMIPFYCLKGNHNGVTYGIDGLILYGTTPFTIIEKNDRICQFRIVEKMPQLIITEVEKMTDNPRGGFGSTGVK